MNSVQESKNELNAAIRYAENAISSAKTTIESMEFRQEMAQKQYAEQTGREEALTKQVQELEERNDELNIQIVEQTNREATLEREVTINTAQANAWKKEYDKIKDQYQGLYDDNVGFKREVADLKAQVNALEQPEQPTMPVIPKAVAIAIFREGVQRGVEAACAELEGQRIEVSENEYCGNFEVSFNKEIDLDDELDLDWMRGKVGDYSEETVIDALGNLCADKKFECRIHGVDDQEEKKND
jgi:chromosome segregation ATPase